MKKISISMLLVLAIVVVGLSIGFVVIKKVFFNKPLEQQTPIVLNKIVNKLQSNEKEVIQLKQELNQARKKVEDYKREFKKQQGVEKAQTVAPVALQGQSISNESKAKEPQEIDDNISQDDLQDKIENIQEDAALSDALENCLRDSDDEVNDLTQDASNEKQDKAQKKYNDNKTRWNRIGNSSQVPAERKKMAKKLDQVQKDVSGNLESNKKQLFDKQGEEIKKAVIKTVGGAFEEMQRGK